MGQDPGAGWAPDPYQRHEQRWWDGQQWTDHVLVHGETKLDPIAFAAVPPGAHLGAPTSQVSGASEQDRGQPGPTRFLSTRRHVVLAVLLLGLASLACGAALRDGGVVPLVTASPPEATGSVPALAGPPTSGEPGGVALLSGTDSSSTPGPGTPGVGTMAIPTTGSTPGTGIVGPTTGAASPAWPTSASLGPTQGTPVTNPARAPAGSTTPAVGPTSTTSTEGAAPTTSVEPAPKDYANCSKLHADHPHGVGLPGAVDDAPGSKQPVTDFRRDRPLYRTNADLDRDGDAIACEA